MWTKNHKRECKFLFIRRFLTQLWKFRSTCFASLHSIFGLILTKLTNVELVALNGGRLFYSIAVGPMYCSLLKLWAVDFELLLWRVKNHLRNFKLRFKTLLFRLKSYSEQIIIILALIIKKPLIKLRRLKSGQSNLSTGEIIVSEFDPPRCNLSMWNNCPHQT